MGREKPAKPQPMFRVLTSIVPALLCMSAAQGQMIQTIRVNGVDLHYLKRGRGEPVVFVHGGLDDYRMWQPEIESFAQHYRVLNYSRRYSFPNRNGPLIDNYSAITDAEDLAALLEKLQLGPVHIVAHSYGGYAALFLAIRHPELIRSLILAEPAALCWARDTAEAKLLFVAQIEKLWKPAREAFMRGNDEDALRVTLNYFEGQGAYDLLPTAAQQQLKEDLPEWRALAFSRDAFPSLPQDEAAKINKPVLHLSGENTMEIFKFVDRELQRLLARSEHVTIANAKHEMWADNEEACRRATLQFLAAHVAQPEGN
jgi:non-heme chloroperoxidase